jgi:hypothetical protein
MNTKELKELSRVAEGKIALILTELAKEIEQDLDCDITTETKQNKGLTCFGFETKGFTVNIKITL